MARQVFPTPGCPLIPMVMGAVVARERIIFCISFRPVNNAGSGGGRNRSVPLSFISEIIAADFLTKDGSFLSFSGELEDLFELEDWTFLLEGPEDSFKKIFARAARNKIAMMMAMVVVMVSPGQGTWKVEG
jgi:hypothetical protein